MENYRQKCTTRKPTKNNIFITDHHTQKIRRMLYLMGLLIRARRICSKDTDFKEEATNIITSLLKRGYPDNILLTAFNRAWSKTQEELLKPSKKSEDNRIRLITTYNQRKPSNEEDTTKIY